MSIIQKILHAGEGRRLKAVEAIVPEINALEPEVERLSDDDLRARTNDFRSQIDRARAVGKDAEHGEELVVDLLHDLLPPAFATVREAGRRVLGQRHFDVQLMGGAALHLGWVAEMKTGEGKTLVATLPCYLNALAGGACTSSPSTTISPSSTPTGWASSTVSSGCRSGRSFPTTRRPRRSARSTTATSPTARTTSSGSTTSATTWSPRSKTRCSAGSATSRSRRTTSRSSTRSTRS